MTHMNFRRARKNQAGPPEGEKQTVLSELAVYLPDYQPEEPFDDAGPGSLVVRTRGSQGLANG